MYYIYHLYSIKLYYFAFYSDKKCCSICQRTQILCHNLPHSTYTAQNIITTRQTFEVVYFFNISKMHVKVLCNIYNVHTTTYTSGIFGKFSMPRKL